MSDLTTPQQAALKSLPWWLTATGNLSSSAPHAGILRALEQRGLARLNLDIDQGRWERTTAGDAELAWLEGQASTGDPSRKGWDT